MNRVLNFTAALTIAAVGSLGLSLLAMAGPAGEHLNSGYELNVGEDACPSGNKILNVNYKINNSIDSGTGTSDNGNVYWAYIDYILQVQVIETADNTFCARVKTQGSFESIGGDGPGCVSESNCGDPAGRLESGVVGTLQGGYTGTFEGTFTPDGQKTKGSIGTFDHNCDAAAGTCDSAGVTRWRSLYFTEVAASNIFAWWGWVYHAGDNGSWVNSGDGNSGNITGE